MKKRPDQQSQPERPDRAQFSTNNPRHCRALALLLQRPAKREEIDNRAGCSNAPDLVAELRRRGLTLPCQRVPALDRDGRPCRPGVYHLTGSDRAKVIRWIAGRRT